MELFVPKLDQHAPCFAISEKTYVLQVMRSPVHGFNALVQSSPCFTICTKH